MYQNLLFLFCNLVSFLLFFASAKLVKNYSLSRIIQIMPLRLFGKMLIGLASVKSATSSACTLP